jgi:sigma-B regulation protein RsbU (phosphoserine phosphatase)
MLLSSLGAALVIGITGMAGILNARKTSLSLSDILGSRAAELSQRTLAETARVSLVRLARDSAALTDEKLIAIQNYTRMVSDIATWIYTNRSQYPRRPVNYLSAENAGTKVQYLRTAPGVSLASIGDEVAIMGNVINIQRQITIVDLGITQTYVSGEAGYHISVAQAAAGVNSRDYDPRSRTWYQTAKEKDGLAWSGIFRDSLGRGTGITCAMPWYDLSGGKRVMKGVVGNGILLADNVSKIVESVKTGETGYAFILNEKGQVILSPKLTDLVVDAAGNVVGEDYLHSEEAGKRELAGRMLSRESGVMELDIDGSQVYAAFHPLSAIGWSFAVVVPIDEVIAPALQIRSAILGLTGEEVGVLTRNILFIIVCMLVVIAFATAGTVFVAGRLSRSLTAQIVTLSEEARLIGGGDLDRKLEVKSGDEIEELADTFNRMIQNIKEVTAEKQRINSELSVAADIQNDMLPKIFPRFTSSKRFDLYAKMAPAKEVGGDFYDFYYLDEKETKIVFVIADVSGKGVPAALFMVIAKTLLKQYMLHYGDPAMALEQVNKVLNEDNPRSMFVTAFIAAMDLLTGMVIYANGGHNPPILSAAGKPYEFLPVKKGVPPGMIGKSTYQTSFLQMNAGDRLYLYTDGVNEAMNNEGEQWGNGRFLEAANKYRELSPQGFDEAIRAEISAFANGTEQSDDITSVAILYKEPPK